MPATIPDFDAPARWAAQKARRKRRGLVSLRNLLLLCLVVVVIQAVCALAIAAFLDDWSVRGTFGDMFGAVNTLFSGLAFAGVIYAILLQRRELELQRRELQMTRRELKRSAEAQEKSEQSLAAQAEALRLSARVSMAGLLPALNVSLDVNGGVSLNILNIGDTSAFDVDILVLGVYPQDGVPQDDFVRRYVISGVTRDQVGRLYRPYEGFFGLTDRIVHAVFPRRRRNVAALGFPLPPFAIDVLLQFRDVRGENYLHIYGFHQEAAGDGSSGYRLGHVSPPTPLPAPRVSFREYTLRSEGGGPLPDPALEEFQAFWGACISSAFTTAGVLGVEDRGEWQPL